MNKKLIALAIAGALSPLASMADESSVTVYGKVNLGLESVKATGGTIPSQDVANRLRVHDSFSYLGFRGNEPLGGGTSAFFQIESLIKADNNGAGNTFASRNSGVGLRGGFGEILMGRWDTYYSNHLSPVSDLVFARSSMASTALAILGGQAGIGGNVTGAEHGGRINNVVRYTTPNLGGFTARVGYVAPEGKAADNPATPASEAVKDDGVEVSLTYANPNLGFFNYSYYRRNDVALGAAAVPGAVRDGNDSINHKATVGTKLGPVTVGLVYERLKDRDMGSSRGAALLPLLGLPPAAVLGLEGERDAIVGAIGYENGPFGIFGTYGQAKKVKVAGTEVADTGAKYAQLTATYALSKRTNLWGTVARITNERLAGYDFFNQAALVESGTAVGIGADPQSFGVGIAHFF